MHQPSSSRATSGGLLVLLLVATALVAVVPVRRAAAAPGPAPVDLLPLGQESSAFAVNALGQVLGSAAYDDGVVDVGDHATLWSAAGDVTDLGTLGGSSSYGRALTDGGRVVGFSQTAGDGAEHAFVWDPIGGMVDLGTLGGSSSYADAVNEAGTVAGVSFIDGDAATHAFVWQSGTGMADLGTLGGSSSRANDVNETGRIVGAAATPGDAGSHAFVWESGSGMVDLGTLGGTSSYASAVSDGGRVVGFSTLPGDAVSHAFVWDDLGGMVDLGTLGGAYSEARGISDSGAVYGLSSTSGGSWHAFVWTADGGMVDLGTLGGASSEAWGANALGQVVGVSKTAGGDTHGFVWDAVNGMVDLGTLGGSGSSAFAINAAGRIAGSSSLGDDVTVHATQWSVPAGVLFTPMTPERILDSRAPSRVGPFSTPWGASTTRDVTVRGGGTGVPADAEAVALNVTVTTTTEDSFLTMWPKGAAQPLASSLNWAPGWTVPNAVTVKVGDLDQVSVFNRRGSVDVIIDVVGYYGPTGSGFTATTPARVQDSRPGSVVGPYSSPWAAETTRDVRVRGASTGVPGDATAVVLNVTADRTTDLSYLTIWPKGAPRPLASSVNWAPGWTIPNAVTVGVGDLDRISIYNKRGSVDVIVDVVGYFSPSGGAKFHPLAPSRIQDSRPDEQVGPYDTPWAAGTARAVTVADGTDVPTAADGVLMNVTVTGTTSASYLSIYPQGAARPVASNLNWVAGWTIPNAVTAKVGDGGQVAAYNNQGAVDVVIDLAGWYG